MGAQNTLVARLTLTKRDGSKLIVEVHTDAGFHNFYRWHTQQGRKRKVLVRTSNRNDGLERYDQMTKPGLSEIVKRMQATDRNNAAFSKIHRPAHMLNQPAVNSITSAVLKVYKKRLYAKLLSCPPTELNDGLTKAISTLPENHHWERSETPILVGNWPSSSLRNREAQLAGGRR
jgi:hypothetical protein